MIKLHIRLDSYSLEDEGDDGILEFELPVPLELEDIVRNFEKGLIDYEELDFVIEEYKRG